MQTRTIELNGNPFFVRCWGSADLPPLLMLHGDADHLVPDSGTREFFAQVTQADKKLIIYEGGYHESHNDTHHAQVVADLEEWIEAHM